MPLPNRVRPDGSLFADPARGLLFGNRGGRFHDPATKALPTRLFATKQWICCVLSFKGRQRDVWGRYYTELFFCDEVTALAAGHRPCVECRRVDAHAYRAALVAGLGLAELPLFPAIDERLDRERRDGRRNGCTGCQRRACRMGRCSSRRRASSMPCVTGGPCSGRPQVMSRAGRVRPVRLPSSPRRHLWPRL